MPCSLRERWGRRWRDLGTPATAPVILIPESDRLRDPSLCSKFPVSPPQPRKAKRHIQSSFGLLGVSRHRPNKDGQEVLRPGSHRTLCCTPAVCAPSGMVFSYITKTSSIALKDQFQPWITEARTARTRQLLHSCSLDQDDYTLVGCMEAMRRKCVPADQRSVGSGMSGSSVPSDTSIGPLRLS